ncbi:tyrosine-type recombinase/integrase [Fontivita pretiosa]|uniref:tyrosine-type recombinase/integrase n=1 Tax=Fontivita pretiosa TaxID=2989684 RepID=UPI003D1869A0
MPDPTRIPAYRHHKASGQAVVTLEGRDIYLGTYKSAASRAEYNRLIAEWLAAGRRLPTDPASVTVAEVAAAFRQHARTYYRRPDGTPTSEVRNFDVALRPLLKLYGRTPAAEFDAVRLKAVRQAMIDAGWTRRSINKNTNRIRQVFKWAAENKLAPASVFHELQVVAGLKAGRSEAREADSVKPVPIEYVEAVLPYVSRQVAAMIRLQLLTGMRPGEVCSMRACDIDTTGALWVYRPSRHKTLHHGHQREIYLGPRAQEIVKPFLRPGLGEYLFSPADAERERREAMHAARRTPASCGNVPGSNRKLNPRKKPGACYTPMSYHRAVREGCDKADAHARAQMDLAVEQRVIPRWNPHRLRHNAATELRKNYGLEAAQVILGHKTLTVTQVYAEKNVEQAKRIMAQVG